MYSLDDCTIVLNDKSLITYYYYNYLYNGLRIIMFLAINADSATSEMINNNILSIIGPNSIRNYIKFNNDQQLLNNIIDKLNCEECSNEYREIEINIWTQNRLNRNVVKARIVEDNLHAQPPTFNIYL